MLKTPLGYILYFLAWVGISLILPHLPHGPWTILIVLILAYLPMWVIASRDPHSLPAELWGGKPQSRRARRASIIVISMGTFIGIQMRKEPYLPPWLAPYFAERWYGLIACFLASALYMYFRGYRLRPEDWIDPDGEEEDDEAQEEKE